MKTIAVTIPEELNAEAAAEAKRRGISKSELIRLGLSAILPEVTIRTEANLWRKLAGFAPEGVTAEPGEIDDVVYRS
jgi:hypothetical protein